jgi:hypothetical protein
MTFDTHLINLAMAGIGISAGVAVLMALAIIGAFAWRMHDTNRSNSVITEPIRHEEISRTTLRQAA